MSAWLGRLSARRRPNELRIVRSRLIWVGAPEVEMPARRQTLFGVSLSVVRTRFGSSRSSKKMSRISSCVMVNSKSSSPSPESDASFPPCPAPVFGLSIVSPGVKSLLPGSTKSRSPEVRGSRRKRGSLVPRAEILILRSLPMSATAASLSDFCTASRICVRARRRKRWRLPRLLPLGLRRRSMKCVMAHSSGMTSHSPRLVDPHVPFDEAANLSRRVASRQHALDEFVVFVRRLIVLLRLERNYRQEILNLGEHPLFDDGANFLVSRPGRILAVVLGAITQREL